MRKNGVLILIAIFIFSITQLMAQLPDKNDLWKRAGSEQDPEARLQLLKEYEQNFGQDQNERTKFLYMNLSLLSFSLKKFNETIQYGEKALIFKDEFKENNKLQLFFMLANSYLVTATDLDKAIKHANELANLATQLKNSDNPPPGMDNKWIAPALRIQARAYYSKGKDNPEDMKMATVKAIEAYKVRPNRDTAKLILAFANNLYNKQMYQEAIDALKSILDENNPNPKYLEQLAKILSKKGDKDQAVQYFVKAYHIRMKGKLAYNIAIILLNQKKEQEAVPYLADASQLPSNYKVKAKKLLESVIWHKIYKDKTPEEKEAILKQELIKAGQRVKSNAGG